MEHRRSVNIHWSRRTDFDGVPSALPFVLAPNTIHPTKHLFHWTICSL